MMAVNVLRSYKYFFSYFHFNELLSNITIDLWLSLIVKHNVYSALT